MQSTTWLDFNDAPSQFLIANKKDLSLNELKQCLNNKIETVLYHLFPNGRIINNTFVIGDIKGSKGDSLKVGINGHKVGLWHDFATNEGGNIISLWAAVYGWDCHHDFSKIIRSINDWLGTPQAPIKVATKTYELGSPTGKWNYHDERGKLIACVYRYDTINGKEFRPWDVKTQKYQTPDPRPLYNQNGIANSKEVILVEGEKCTDALIKINICATTAMMGANAAIDKTDWSPLKGKHVVIWPDHDMPGQEYADKVIKKLSTIAASISMIKVPADKAVRWDADDAIKEGLDIKAFIKEHTQIITAVLPKVPAFTFGQLLSDTTPLAPDLIAPRILTPGGLLVFGGAPKVGKTDLLLSWLVNLSGGIPFLGMLPTRPLKIFYLQMEIMYDYLRERSKKIHYDDDLLPLINKNLVITPRLQILLNEDGIMKIYHTVTDFFKPEEVDIIVIDPLRNVYDGDSENDNITMMNFLTERVEKLRHLINPHAGVILTHHTKKLTKKMVEEDPFQALSGATSLRSFYTTGMLLFRPDEQQSVRQIIFELRNGKSVPTKLVDKLNDRWQELSLNSERIIRKDYGQKQDAERNRCHDVILQMIADEAAKGNLYTPAQFSRAFENCAGLSSERTIRSRIDILATKGFIKFNRKEYKIERSKSGVMCVEDMAVPMKEIDPLTDELMMRCVLPTHFKESQTGVILPVENPEIWVYL